MSSIFYAVFMQSVPKNSQIDQVGLFEIMAVNGLQMGNELVGISGIGGNKSDLKGFIPHFSPQ